MSTLTTWGLIGHGNIGKEIERQIGQPDVARRLGIEAKPEFIVNSSGQAGGKPFSDIVELPDVIFIAIPSSDDGKVAYNYISSILAKGKLVVTAEKGALANYFNELRAESGDFKHLGVTATVGGGTRVMQVARQYCQDLDNITQIHLALNGTLAAIMAWVSPASGTPISLSKAAAKAVELGYAEPGSDSAVSIIRAEAEGDIPKKLSIFCDAVGLTSNLIDWNDLRFSLTDAEITEATNPTIPRRFIVSLYRLTSANSPSVEDDIVGGFKVTHDQWLLVGGFRRMNSNPLFGALATLSGPGNGMVIGLGPDASDGVYAVTGPGAGVSPTVNTMLDDYLRLSRVEVNA